MSDIDYRELVRCRQIVEESRGVITDGMLRWWVFNARSNGLAEAGAVVRVGRAVFLHRPRFNRWLSHAADREGG